VTKIAVAPFDPPYPKNPMLHANFMAVFCRSGVMADRTFTLQKDACFTFFCSCDLDLDPMIFIYELDPYFLEIYRMCKYELPTSRLSKVVIV